MDGAFDPGPPPPELLEAEPAPAVPRESFQQKARRRADEDQMRKQLEELEWYGMLASDEDA